MSEHLHKKITAWLAGELARVEHRQMIRLELLSAQQGFKGEPIQTWERQDSPEMFEVGNADNLVSDIVRQAQEYADSFGQGTHRFVLRTEQYLGGKAKHAFRIQSEDSEESEAGGSDAPNMTGLLAQVLRHNEVLLRTHLQGSTAMVATLARRLGDNEEYVAKLLSERNRQFDELEEARSKQTDRDLELMKLTNSESRKEAGFQKLLQLAPAVVNRLAGKSLIPEKQTPLELMISDLAKSLSPDQVQTIASVLNPQQQITLMEAFRAASVKASSAEAKPEGNTEE